MNDQWFWIADLEREIGTNFQVFRDSKNPHRFRIEYQRPDGSNTHRTVDFTR